MDIVEIKNRAFRIKSKAQTLTNKYQSIITVLSNLNNMLQSKQPNNASAISDLIEEYKGVIRLINTNCIEFSDKVIKYSDNLAQDLKELDSNLNNLLKELDNSNVIPDIDSL